MPLTADRIQETTTTGGTGTITLAGAVTGYRTFNSVFSNGNVVFYCIDDGLGNWEVGYGTVGTGTLTRSTVLDSSNGGSLVNFAAGSSKRVFNTAPSIAVLPDQTSNSGKVLTTNGSTPSWTTPTSGTVTSVSGTGTVSGISLSGTVTSTGNLTLSGSLDLSSPPAIGGTTAAAGKFTTLEYTSTLTGGTGVIAIGTNQIYKDSSGNVGIGTSSPNAPLSFANSISGTAGLSNKVQLYNSGGSAIFGFGLYTGQLTYNCGDGAHVFYTNGGTPVERMRLDSSGNLGLGVTPNGWLSTVSAIQLGSAGVISATKNGTANSQYRCNDYVDTSGTVRYIVSDYAARYQQYLGQHIWYNAPSGTAGNAISFTQAMTLDASGNLLVGGTSALNSERLSVVGGNGIFCRTQYAISSTAVTIAASAGCLLLLRDNNNGQTALVLYENAVTPIIISQSGSNYTTGTPTGTQIKIQNKSGNQGVSVVMAAGQSTTLNVCVISCDDS